MSKVKKISFGQGMGMAAEAAPVLLLISMLGCFTFIGYAQYLFYSKEFIRGMGSNASMMGGLVAVMIQLCRLASGLSSSLHYKRGSIFSALTVFCFSVGLSFWEWHEIELLSKAIGGRSSIMLLQFCVVVSLALEFGLASTIESEVGADEDEVEVDGNYSFSSKGATKKEKLSRSRN